MLDRVKQTIPMPDYMAEQMPELMPMVMDNLMPHMIDDVVPLVTQPMIDYMHGKERLRISAMRAKVRKRPNKEKG